MADHQHRIFFKRLPIPELGTQNSTLEQNSRVALAGQGIALEAGWQWDITDDSTASSALQTHSGSFGSNCCGGNNYTRDLHQTRHLLGLRKERIQKENDEQKKMLNDTRLRRKAQLVDVTLPLGCEQKQNVHHSSASPGCPARSLLQPGVGV